MRARVVVSLLALAILSLLAAQTRGVRHGVRPQRLIIRNATVVDGNGPPARGPMDIVSEGDTIVDVVPLDPVAVRRGEGRRPQGDVQIDAAGRARLRSRSPCGQPAGAAGVRAGGGRGAPESGGG
jgi:hypothetical protein